MTFLRSMKGSVVRIAMAVAVSLTTAACDGSTGPSGRFSGTWDLTLIDGQTLPRVYEVYGFGATKQLLGGTLEFTSSSRLAESRDWRNTAVGAGAVPEDLEYNTSASFSGSQDRIIVQRPQIPGAAAYADTGLVNGDVLILPVRTVDGTGVQSHTLTYVKR